jgi:hypothetical protein
MKENSIRRYQRTDKSRFKMSGHLKLPSETEMQIKVFHPPIDAQFNCLKNNFKIYIKIDIKTAPKCFGAIAIIRERIIRAC